MPSLDSESRHAPGACVALSAGSTALPGDTGTPVAEQLAQLSGNLGIVLAVLYLDY